nr:TetR/AcrR family transcriptional regulator [Clostridiisalibacter paucivorans]
MLEASLRIFSTKGYHTAKMEGIAKEAGIGKGTLYEYFKGKKHLFHEMLKYTLIKYKEEEEKVLDMEGPIRDKLIAFSAFNGRFLSEYMDLAENVMNSVSVLSDDVKVWMMKKKTELIKVLQEVIQQSIDSGELRKDLNAELATLALSGTIRVYYGKRLNFDKEKYSNIDPALPIDMMLEGMVDRDVVGS